MQYAFFNNDISSIDIEMPFDQQTLDYRQILKEETKLLDKKCEYEQSEIDVHIAQESNDQKINISKSFVVDYHVIMNEGERQNASRVDSNELLDKSIYGIYKEAKLISSLNRSDFTEVSSSRASQKIDQQPSDINYSKTQVIDEVGIESISQSVPNNKEPFQWTGSGDDEE